MENSGSGRELGIFEILTLIFVVLKLIGKIDWSWWWVLSPLWIAFILAFLIYCINEL